MKITERQAQELLDFMADAAEAAAEDERFGESWRIARFRNQANELTRVFNKAAEPE